jgi:hypothetical protein
LADRAFTFSYFIPTMVGLMEATDSPAAVAVATQWWNLNYLRHAIVLAAWLAAFLIVPLGLVAWNPWYTQFIQYSRNVLVLELDRAMRPTNLGHEDGAMPGFDVWSPGEIGSEHGEVVGDDHIAFVSLPMRPDLRFVSHLSYGRYALPLTRLSKPVPNVEEATTPEMIRAGGGSRLHPESMPSK